MHATEDTKISIDDWLRFFSAILPDRLSYRALSVQLGSSCSAA